MAARVEHLAAYLDAVDDHPWFGVCLDTCHAWAAGHDLATPGGMTDDAGPAGQDRAAKTGCGWCTSTIPRTPAGRSGTGTRTSVPGSIGEAAFAELVTHPATLGRTDGRGDAERRRHADTTPTSRTLQAPLRVSRTASADPLRQLAIASDLRSACDPGTPACS